MAEHGHRITAAIACHVARAGGTVDQLTHLLMHPDHEGGRHTQNIAMRSGQARALAYVRRRLGQRLRNGPHHGRGRIPPARPRRSRSSSRPYRGQGRTSILDPYKPHVHQRWQEGCTNATRLFEELRERGYRGGLTVVRRYVHQLREAFPQADPPRRPPSVRDVTSWLTRHPDHLDEDRTQQLKTVLSRCPELDQAAQHVRSFAELMNNRNGHRLGQWIEAVQADDVPSLHTFTAGLGQDLDAVVAGLSMRYSSGAVEGHNNRIKMLKRQMFGRANFDLLRKRVLLAA
ncbi:transposase [Streptomyces sp. NPDC046862]|uniref:transposase n=1 Tax=Streptomyces sp. NPDC046862 TaxID=3154603 RepID=UPI003453E46E